MANIGETESTFNPPVPAVQEDLKASRILNEARSITQPRSPKSTETALSGFGTLLDETVKGLHQAKTTALDETMRRDIGQMKEDRIHELESFKANPAITGGAGGQIGPVGVPLPRAVSEVGDKLEMLRDLRANGHISNTAYDARLRMYLSDLRAQNPGFRDYIDDQGKKIIGYDPANAQITQLTQDINALGAKQLDERKFMIQRIATEYSNKSWAQSLSADIAAGKAGMREFLAAVGPADDLKNTARDLEQQEKIDKHIASLSIDTMASKVIADVMNDLHIGQGLYTGKQMDENLEKWNRGEFPEGKNPEVLARMGQSAELLKERARRMLVQWGTQPVTLADGSTTTYRTAIGGPKAFEEYVNQALEPMQKRIDMIKNQDWGPLNYVERTSKYIKDAAKLGIMQNDQIGRAITNADALRTMVPEADKVIRENLLQNDKFTNSVKGLLAVNVPAQTTEPNNSATKTVETLRKAGVTQKAAYDQVMNWYNTIMTNPNATPEAKEQTLWNLVKPENQGLLDMFNESPTTTVDNKGVQFAVPAKYGYYFQFTKKDFVQEVGKVGGTAMPAYIQRTGEWLGDLFTSDARTIGQFQGKITWDGKNHQFIEINEMGTGTRPGERTGALGGKDPNAVQVNQAIRRLNIALQGYSRVLDLPGQEKDKNVAIMGILQNMGVDIRPGSEGRMQTEPEQTGLSKIGAAIRAFIIGNKVKELPQLGEKPR